MIPFNCLMRWYKRQGYCGVAVCGDEEDTYLEDIFFFYLTGPSVMPQISYKYCLPGVQQSETSLPLPKFLAKILAKIW